jgi:hypothetical protein
MLPPSAGVIMPLELSSEEERELSLTSPVRGGAETVWVLLFLNGVILGCSSLYWMTRGRFFDPQFYEAITGSSFESAILSTRAEALSAAGVRLAGFLGFIGSVFIVAVSATSFRRGERWAWYAMWTLPLLATLDFALLAGYEALSPIAVCWDAMFLVLSLAALIGSANSFFRERK